jgi:hypothetical protein
MFAQGPKFSLGDKNKFEPMEVKVNSLMIDIVMYVMREFRSFILLQIYLSLPKGANPRSYFSFIRATKTFNNSICHFMHKLN